MLVHHQYSFRLLLIICILPADASSLYYVLKTNYDDYAIIISCQDQNAAKNEQNVLLTTVSILSRKLHIDSQFVAEILQTLLDNNISTSSLESTIQNCDYSTNF